MPDTLSIWGRSFVAAGVWSFLLLFPSQALKAQELPYKRSLPGTDTIACPTLVPSLQPGPEEREQATRLGSEANQQQLLGDMENARDLLARATQLDPTSADLAYRYGRVLESLEEVESAIDQFCRALALGSREQGIGDARPRLEALARAREPELSEAAGREFLNGLLQTDLGNLRGAEEAFGLAIQEAPDWADAVYNRGVVRARLGETDLAVEDLQQYLSMRPTADDAMLVSQRIGRLQVRPASALSAGTALGLGIVLPGMGQFYSGRALTGLGVLSLASAAVAAGVLIEKVEVRCVGGAPSGGDCPADRVISEDKSNPYLVPGLVAAGVVSVIGAVEAFIKAQGHAGEQGGEATTMDVGKPRITGPMLSARGRRLQLHLFRVTF